MGSPSYPEASSDEIHLILIVQLFSPCLYQYSEMIKIKRGEKPGLENFTTPAGVEMWWLPIYCFDWKFKSYHIAGNWEPHRLQNLTVYSSICDLLTLKEK